MAAAGATLAGLAGRAGWLALPAVPAVETIVWSVAANSIWCFARLRLPSSAAIVGY